MPNQTDSQSASNAALIEALYSAFSRQDGAAMAALYLPDAEFSDPVFPDLHGPQIGAMWQMLCERAKDFSLTYSGVHADQTSGEARWEAHYTFSGTGNKVKNSIHARFQFKPDPNNPGSMKIARHTDEFSLYRWASQALGLKGRLLGFLPPVQAKIRAQSAALLADYLKKRGSTTPQSAT